MEDQAEQHQKWWQRKQQHWLAIGVITIILVVVVAFIIVGYYNGTGFNGYNKITTSKTVNGINPPTVTTTEEYQQGITIWDLLNLLGVLAIPVVVGLGAAWYTAQQGKVNDKENSDNQRETALQAYIDKMSELLLKENLRESEENAEVRKIARARTLTVLPNLNAARKRSLLQFLHESDLLNINRKNSVIILVDADLSNANLKSINLWNADLNGANISGADLSHSNLRNAYLIRTNLSGTNLSSTLLNNASLDDANLQGAYLIGTDLSGASLSGADLKGADLSQAILKGTVFTDATMPDGSIHS